MENYFDTICAITTPLAVSSVGVIRLSGDKSWEIAQKIFSKIIKKGINYGWIVNNGAKIDEVLVLAFCAPNSFTGEDVIEIQTHGSPIILKEILGFLIDNGAKMAERGEFSKRAFLNHKIDMTQAEAILDLIHSKTSKFAVSSAQNLSGVLTSKIAQIKDEIKNIYAKIIASLDFPEDVAEVEYDEIKNVLQSAKTKIEEILKSAYAHNILREGIKIAVVGNVNVGKSSLFNALLNIERAIVTDIEGTTRDAITETLDINGISATLIDTAGFRESDDKVEKIGIDNAKKYASEADLVLCLFDGSKELTEDDLKMFELAKKKIIVATKADIKECKNHCDINISSKTGYNLKELKEKIYNEIMGFGDFETEFSTNQRQQACLKDAKKSLEIALSAVETMELQDLISIDIKASLLALDEITGEVLTDNILDDIFENFCIGK
ncbi:MAG: tRNA uridine-5-carboxymethylaminomethyl(34) synthesis GTPase MnmE [Cyanobacteria bacterium SIG30]|nr:tRNA uridine-5-carboxymethylaminomethyl(34) synthesis GTPase MnmE [Cyanobacteria bacterium SIG30]